MIWMTWRQFRTQAIVAAAGLALFAVLLAITGLNLAHLYSASGVPGCHPHGDCAVKASNFIDQVKASKIYQPVFFGGIFVLFAVPALTGVFWGAPLITREIESGTFRLAWNQSVTRTRWLTVKLGLIGLAAMATAGLLSLLESWWASPIDSATALSANGRGGSSGFARIDPVIFGARGIAPIGYAALAFALGVTAGVLLRRTIPAMATTLAGFAFIQIAWPTWVRPHLISPVTSISALNVNNIQGLSLNQNGSRMTVFSAVDKPGAWILSNQTIDKAGHVFAGPAPNACMSQTTSFQACQNSLASLRLRQLLTYQPDSRFWALQWYETGIFLVLAVALAWFCIWWINRRRIA
jgi:hypothetical protein